MLEINIQDMENEIEMIQSQLLAMKSRSDAWDAVVNCLTDVTGSGAWFNNGDSGIEAACNTIRMLANKGYS